MQLDNAIELYQEAPTFTNFKMALRTICDYERDGMIEASTLKTLLSELLDNSNLEWSPDSHWDNHPDWPTEDWAYEAITGDTRQSYIEWVNSRLQEPQP